MNDEKARRLKDGGLRLSKMSFRQPEQVFWTFKKFQKTSD
jgi:hypothetical protein